MHIWIYAYGLGVRFEKCVHFLIDGFVLEPSVFLFSVFVLYSTFVPFLLDVQRSSPSSPWCRQWSKCLYIYGWLDVYYFCCLIHIVWLYLTFLLYCRADKPQASTQPVIPLERDEFDERISQMSVIVKENGLGNQVTYLFTSSYCFLNVKCKGLLYYIYNYY